MKKLFKIRYLGIIALWLPLAAAAAEGAPGAPGAGGKRFSPEERKARMEQCHSDPTKCQAEFRARREQWCKDNAERCKEMQAKMEQRRAECQANPEKCRAERMARFEQRFKTADADGNGMISRGEAEKGLPRLARRFDRIDANKDGEITRDEMATARKAHMERRKPRPEPSKI